MKFLVVLFVSFALISCNSEKQNSNNSGNSKSDQQENSKNDDTRSLSPIETDETGLSRAHAVIKTAHGNILFKFYPKIAPNTVARIIKLIKSGFYDGVTFHRVVHDFVIQGGDPTGTGSGGSGKKLKAEFSSLKHIKGAVAMARAQDPDSADSQFYIALGELPHLDGQYTIFGQVIEGIDILTKIIQGDKIISISFLNH